MSETVGFQVGRAEVFSLQFATYFLGRAGDKRFSGIMYLEIEIRS